MGNVIDLTGMIFGRLNVLKRDGSDSRGESRWLCVCECGNKTTVLGSILRRGLTKSCGCLRDEYAGTINKTHGYSNKTSEYSIWWSMVTRCENQNCKAYPYYGGRGIKVCKEWRDNFVRFLSDMGKRPSSKHSLDRIDVNGDYEPNNCRWATPKEQARNKRTSRNNKTGVKGVSFVQRDKKFVATIFFEGRNVNLGSYETLEEAATARKEGELTYWGGGVN